MRQNSRGRLCVFCLGVLFALMLTGCATEQVYLNDAADAYAAGKYDEAETYFLKAIRNGEKSVTVFSGYAFNQLKAGDVTGAKALFELMMNQQDTYGNYFDKEPETGEAVRKSLLDIYIAENEYEKAINLLKQLGNTVTDPTRSAQYKASAAALAWRVSNYGEDGADPLYNPDELIALITESIDAGNADVKNYRMRADMYWIKEEWDLWEKDERMIVSLKDFAMDEYRAIFGMTVEKKGVEDVLKLVDEAVVYFDGHSAYADNFTDIIPIVLKGAEYARRTDWEHDEAYYFDLAEKYLNAAQDKNLSDNELLKYQIIVAEKKGKMELAYKLLGVYLSPEHCPDDRMAYKEQKYLENRIGVSTD